MAGADTLEQANRIRRYVEAVRAANVESPTPLPTEQLESWSAWALNQADALDPVKSGRFAADFDVR
jgi:hypothetical protein